MERELWPVLYRLLRQTASDFHQKYVRHQPWTLVAVALWAALHDRPLSWACRAHNWTTTRLRPFRLPSASTLSRRLFSVGVGLLWRALEQRIRDAGEPRLLSFIDGKPLTVSGVSGDPDAAYGRGAGEMSKGFKLHAVWSCRAVPEAWEVTPINVGETTVARRLLPQLSHGGYLLADSNYDCSRLSDVAAECGYQLVTPHRHPNSGKGHRYQSPHRRRSIELSRSDYGKELRRQRSAIERSFGNLTSFGGGMGPPPAWVRRLHRVRTWVWAKLLINGIRILNLQGLTSSLQ